MRTFLGKLLDISSVKPCMADVSLMTGIVESSTPILRNLLVSSSLIRTRSSTSQEPIVITQSLTRTTWRPTCWPLMKFHFSQVQEYSAYIPTLRFHISPTQQRRCGSTPSRCRPAMVALQVPSIRKNMLRE